MNFGPILLVALCLPSAHASSTKTIRDLIEEARVDGAINNPRTEDINFGGVSIEATAKGLEVSPPTAADGATHDVAVYFVADRPDTIVFVSVSRQRSGTEIVNFACDVNGKLRRVYRMTGQTDASGRPSRGAPKAEVLDAKDPKLQAALHHELDFWLKGKYRKTTAKTQKAA